jgi:hypothetical protein
MTNRLVQRSEKLSRFFDRLCQDEVINLVLPNNDASRLKSQNATTSTLDLTQIVIA